MAAARALRNHRLNSEDVDELVGIRNRPHYCHSPMTLNRLTKRTTRILRRMKTTTVTDSSVRLVVETIRQ